MRRLHRCEIVKLCNRLPITKTNSDTFNGSLCRGEQGLTIYEMTESFIAIEFPDQADAVKELNHQTL